MRAVSVLRFFAPHAKTLWGSEKIRPPNLHNRKTAQGSNSGGDRRAAIRQFFKAVAD